MDLGITGRWAIVCAASQGLGKGCAEALGKEGVNLVINARTRPPRSRPLPSCARPARASRCAPWPGMSPTPRCARRCWQPARRWISGQQRRRPPPGDFRDWGREDWLKALDANMLTPIELIKAVVDGMAERGFGRVVNITSGAVKAPIDILGLSNGARSGLTGFIAGLARQQRLAGSNVTLNNLLPGAFDTARLQKTLKAAGGDVEATAQSRRKAIPAARFGSADEFGAYCAFLCSAHAGYITGQNLLIDGGAYPGTF